MHWTRIGYFVEPARSPLVRDLRVGMLLVLLKGRDEGLGAGGGALVPISKLME